MTKSVMLTAAALNLAVKLDEITKRREAERKAFEQRTSLLYRQMAEAASTEINLALNELGELLGLDLVNGQHSLDIRYLCDHGLAFVTSDDPGEEPAVHPTEQ